MVRMLIRTGEHQWVMEELVQHPRIPTETVRCSVCNRVVQDTDAVLHDGEYTCHLCMK